MSLAVTGDQAVRELNRDYRGLDEVTDVLSFSPMHSGHWEGETPKDPNNLDGTIEPDFVYPPGESTPLGDVIIPLPQAQRQAAERSQPLDREMALLIVHGVLHLAGFDHGEPGEESAMQAREQAALKLIPRLEIPHSITHSHAVKGRQAAGDGA